jgi:hypothetical protein
MTMEAQIPCFDLAFVALLWEIKECKNLESSHILVIDF